MFNGQQLSACPAGLKLQGQTCSADVVFANPSAAFEQVLTCSTSRFFGVPRRQSGGTHPADQTVWSFKKLQAPVLDDETWLSEVQTFEKDGSTKVETLGEDGEAASLSESIDGLLAGGPIKLRR
eukprot:6069287-Amphidinium_carterae.1